MNTLISLGINRLKIRALIVFMALVSVACICFSSVDTSGILPQVTEFSVAPNTVCETDSTEVEVSWDSPQIVGCVESPSLTSCDLITELLVGCSDPPPLCKTVSLGSSDPTHDTAIPPDELAGSRSFPISGPTTFSLTNPRTSGELASPVSVRTYNGIPDDDVSEDQFTLTVTCDSSEVLDLKEFYSSCVLISRVCNRNPFVIMVNWDSNLSSTPVRLEPRECLELGVFPERVSAFEADLLGMPRTCGGTDALVGGEPALTDLEDIVLGVQKGGCGIFDEGLGECLFSASMPIVSEPPGEEPTPTPTPGMVPLVHIITTETLCWTGPGNQYDVVSSVQAGTEVELLGTGEIANWWVVDNPRYPGVACWLRENALDVDPQLNLEGLPVFKVPQLPTATITPAPPPPAAPTGLAASEVSCNPNDGYKVKLTWKDNAKNESGYRVYRNNNLIATLGANATQYTTSNIDSGGVQSFFVEAFNAGGAAQSNTANEDGCIY